MVPRQLAFDLPIEPNFSDEDFLVSPSNEAAHAMFAQWPQWPDRVLLLIGPGGAGKSHLATIWAAHAGAEILPPDQPLPGPAAFAAPHFAARGVAAFVIEDADRLPREEAGLFHFLNGIRASHDFLVITARRPPDGWRLATPDLLSRLRLAPTVTIAAPDDALVRAVLVKLFADRQIAIERSVVDYLALRIERSLGAARSVVEALDREALARGRPVTRAVAADVLRQFESVGEEAPTSDAP